MSERDIVVIGVPPSGSVGLGPLERAALAEADVVAGARRHLDNLAAGRQETIEITADLDGVLDAIAVARAHGRRVVVLATGDPGYFGVGRILANRFGTASLDVRPAFSSVAAAFARIGLPWDDAVVVSAHGRPVAGAVGAIRGRPKVAVLTSPDSPPEHLGAELARYGARFDRVVVVSELGLPGESVAEGPDVHWLAAGTFPALSVVVLLSGSGLAGAPTVVAGCGSTAPGAGFGLDDTAYAHRDGMITKAEVRAVVLARLGLPASGVLWDVGAGSGSIAIEAASLAPSMSVFAVERRPEDAERIRANAVRHGVNLEVVEAAAPEALADLPSPDRAVVGGGGLAVLDAVLDRLAPAGRIVATYASVERALGAADRLGSLVQVSVSRGSRLPDSTIRLEALDPVFVCWGPS
jgi:precorrin-6Y C5,15-methyltransferase (decarboxylating)